MEIEIATVGGYEEVGRQMTAVRMDDDIVIFDMGLNLSQVLIHDNVQTERMHSLDLIDMGAIPDDRVMSELDGEIKAIVPTQATSTTSGRSPNSPTATTPPSLRRRLPSNSSANRSATKTSSTSKTTCRS